MASLSLTAAAGGGDPDGGDPAQARDDASPGDTGDPAESGSGLTGELMGAGTAGSVLAWVPIRNGR